jgi:hypothetical protein
MSALGELPPVDVAIHADTGHERTPTRVFAENWTSWLKERGIPVVNVYPKDNRVIQRGAVMPPVFTVSPEGKHGMAPRQCNRDWKVRPAKRHIRKMIRERGLKLLPRTVEQWIAFHAQEARRAERTTSRVAYITHRFPLVELKIGPDEARSWLQSRGLPVPVSSSCVFCPFHDDATWEEIRRCPEDWQKTIDVDRSLRNGEADRRYLSYLHEARQPLEDVFRSVAPKELSPKETYA